ncbi:DMT family transporter [Sphingorhabdus sp.]|jgi:small multidrug resistance pump|uniref:DMT family transporter n=1 Tax=Sphingorhabdus sp. TaxID=1902408 RepID=UPI002FD8D603
MRIASGRRIFGARKLSLLEQTKREIEMNAWIYLAIAIAFEIAGTSLLKASDGFARIGFGIGSMACYWVCFAFLAVAMKSIPVGVSYAIWSGMGIMAITIIGWLVFKQSLQPVQIGFILLILVGAIGLNLTTKADAAEPQRVGSGASPE